MTETISDRQLQGEQRNEERKRRAIRRTPLLVVGIGVVLTLLFGIAAAVDLHRLDTPAGATRAWVQAALVADCSRYAELSAPEGRQRSAPLTAAQCALLAAASPAGGPGRSATLSTTTVVLLPMGLATVDVIVSVKGFPARAARIQLSHASGDWLVLRTPSSCALLTCP